MAFLLFHRAENLLWKFSTFSENKKFPRKLAVNNPNSLTVPYPERGGQQQWAQVALLGERGAILREAHLLGDNVERTVEEHADVLVAVALLLPDPQVQQHILCVCCVIVSVWLSAVNLPLNKVWVN